MAALTVEQRHVKERSTALYTATIEDEAGIAIAAASLTSLTLTLYDYVTGTIINSRDHQDILNAHNVVVGSNGVLTWTMQPLDNIIVGVSIGLNEIERHTALIEWTWSSGTKAGKHEVQIDVENLNKVPSS